ncbi:MAG TPA: hypothetical protein VM870_10190 [Pyrinomonadaceae bacterium]|jgi:hypothetical protein|nr:hypothetical protein [Pyrinomonadaceae bacterium]
MNFLASLFVIGSLLAAPPAQQTPGQSSAASDPVKIKYDRFKDLTRYSLARMSVFGTFFHGVFLRASYSCLGQTDCVPYGVDFTLVIASGDVPYNEPGVLKVTREGEARPLVLRMRHEGREKFDSQLPGTGEIYTVVMKTEDFVRMAEGKKINLQLDDVKFKLTSQNIEALQALARRLKR